MHSSGFSSDKAYCKVDFKCEILGSHTISDQSLLLSTIVLNDMQRIGPDPSIVLPKQIPMHKVADTVAI